MVVNRVGDLGLAVGIFFIFLFFGTSDFLTLFALASSMLELNVSFGAISLKLADLLAFFLFFGVVGKSAQFGLHT